MYAIILDDRYTEIGIFENYARRPYRTLEQISRTIEGTLKIQRVGKRDEWRLLWSADYREIGRVRRVEPAPAPVIAPRPVRFREMVASAAAVVLGILGILR